MMPADDRHDIFRRYERLEAVQGVFQHGTLADDGQILFREMIPAKRIDKRPKTLTVSCRQNDRSANRQGRELTHVVTQVVAQNRIA